MRICLGGIGAAGLDRLDSSALQGSSRPITDSRSTCRARLRPWELSGRDDF
jgi:hypothetical protein